MDVADTYDGSPAVATGWSSHPAKPDPPVHSVGKSAADGAFWMGGDDVLSDGPVH